MKLVALLFAVALLPLAVPAAPAGQGDAAAAVAGAALAVAQAQPDGGVYAGSVAFLLTGSGSIVHPHGVQPGLKPFKNTVKIAQISECIAGTAAGCSDGVTIEANPGDPQAYLFFDSLTSWRVATNSNGDEATTLTGLVDGKGGFMFSGTHALTGTAMLLSGKVVFEKGTLVPKKISGKLSAVAVDQEHYGTGSFKATLLAN
jgi:hypothetical protein